LTIDYRLIDEAHLRLHAAARRQHERDEPLLDEHALVDRDERILSIDRLQ